MIHIYLVLSGVVSDSALIGYVRNVFRQSRLSQQNDPSLSPTASGAFGVSAGVSGGGGGGGGLKVMSPSSLSSLPHALYLRGNGVVTFTLSATTESGFPRRLW
jgi:hypothetical protein